MQRVDSTSEVAALQSLARDIAGSVVHDEVQTVDEDAVWPRNSMRALGEAGLLGLHVDPRDGGLGQGMLALAVVAEELGAVCGSTSLVYGMHCVGTKVIQVRPTPQQCEDYLVPIAAGEHVTTLALSEPGTGSHFYLPRTSFRRRDDRFLVNGHKSFVTSGGEADSYVMSVVAADRDLDPGTFTCLLLDAGTPGAAWQDPWDGFGMRGNSSRGVVMEDAVVPTGNLLGTEGDETWYLFEVITPYFLVAMAGTYLGIARSALEAAIEHLQGRTYAHTGELAGAADTVAHRLGQSWAVVERTRQLVHHAARLADQGHRDARLALFACKSEVADAAVTVANEAMTLTGGIAYGRNSRIARALRDARASHVMAPTTDLLRVWLGRSLLDLPLL